MGSNQCGTRSGGWFQQLYLLLTPSCVGFYYIHDFIVFPKQELLTQYLNPYQPTSRLIAQWLFSNWKLLKCRRVLLFLSFSFGAYLLMKILHSKPHWFLNCLSHENGLPFWEGAPIHSAKGGQPHSSRGTPGRKDRDSGTVQLGRSIVMGAPRWMVYGTSNCEMDEG